MITKVKFTPDEGSAVKLCQIDGTALDYSLTNHFLHCPKCRSHLTSGLLCGKCGIRYEIVDAALELDCNDNRRMNDETRTVAK